MNYLHMGHKGVVQIQYIVVHVQMNMQAHTIGSNIGTCITPCAAYYTEKSQLLYIDTNWPYCRVYMSILV